MKLASLIVIALLFSCSNSQKPGGLERSTGSSGDAETTANASEGGQRKQASMGMSGIAAIWGRVDGGSELETADTVFRPVTEPSPPVNKPAIRSLKPIIHPALLREVEMMKRIGARSGDKVIAGPEGVRAGDKAGARPGNQVEPRPGDRVTFESPDK